MLVMAPGGRQGMAVVRGSGASAILPGFVSPLWGLGPLCRLVSQTDFPESPGRI